MSLTPDGMNGAELDVFAIKRNIERRCTVELKKFTKSSGCDSTDRAHGLSYLPGSRNKILFALWCVVLRNTLFWGCFVFMGIIA